MKEETQPLTQKQKQDRFLQRNTFILWSLNFWSLKPMNLMNAFPKNDT